MLDAFGREVSYLRVSLTQRCNLNCLYCGSEPPNPQELSPDATEKIVKAFVKVGINKVRLTGGEPLLRKDLALIASRLSGISGIRKLGITTNGVCLAEQALLLKEAGIDTVNISLDTIDREQYRRMTGVDALGKVLAGIDAALAAGFQHVRINSVLLRGENEEEAQNLILLAKDRTIDVRFIELMPFSEQGQNSGRIVHAEELLKRFPFLQPVSENDRCGSVAKYYSAPGYLGRIGMITPVSDRFCSACNRVRLLANGSVRPCLGHEKTYDLMPYLNDEDKLMQIIKEAILSKPEGHNFLCAYGNVHAMNKIGG